MTINWTQDEHGNLDWTHEGWSVRIWALENSGLFRDKGVNRIDVESPGQLARRGKNEVDVYDEGVSVESVECVVSIPWTVLEAIFEARKIVNQ
jgi:hypothetical protein